MTSDSNVRKHLIVVHGAVDVDVGVVNVCDVSGCGRVFGSASALRKHISSVHDGVRWYCTWPGCSKDYSSKSTLTKHVYSFHEGWRWRCLIAGCGVEMSGADDVEEIVDVDVGDQC